MPGPHAYSDRTIKKLYALSLNKCYNPDCDKDLVFSEGANMAHVGKFCHIRGANREALRFDERMTDDDRRAFENLIVLCGNCHDKIDDLETGKKYTIEILQNWKNRRKGNDWLPEGHFDEWGEYNWEKEGRRFVLPYYRVGNEIRFFTEEQYAQCEKALHLGIELSLVQSFIDKVICYSKKGYLIPIDEVEKINTGCMINKKYWASWFNPQNGTFIKKAFMLMSENSVRLKDAAWMNTAGNSKNLIFVIDKG